MSLKFSNPEQFIEGYVTSRYKDYETNDCVVKALAILFGISYDESHGFTRGFFSRGERKGTLGFTEGIRSMMRNPHIRFNGVIREVQCMRKETIHSVQKTYSNGMFLVDSVNHVSVLCDGVWLDYEGLISAKTKVCAIYEFSDFNHYAAIRSKLKQEQDTKPDVLSIILLGIIVFALIFKREMVKRDLMDLWDWINHLLFI